MQGVVIKLGNTEQLLNKPRDSVIQGPPIAGCTCFQSNVLYFPTFPLAAGQLVTGHNDSFFRTMTYLFFGINPDCILKAFTVPVIT